MHLLFELREVFSGKNYNIGVVDLLLQITLELDVNINNQHNTKVPFISEVEYKTFLLKRNTMASLKVSE